MLTLRTSGRRALLRAGLLFAVIQLSFAFAFAGAEAGVRSLGPIQPFADRAGLAKALAPVVATEPFCLGVAGQGSNVLLSHSRHAPEASTGMVFPTLVDSMTPGRMRIELEALTHAGLVELATVAGFETYRLTELGHQYYDVGRRDFCITGVELVEIAGVSERMPELGGATMIAAHDIPEFDEARAGKRAYVAFRFRLAGPPRWMKDAGLKRIYPLLRDPDGGIAMAMLQQSEEGWDLVETTPVAE